MSNAWESEFGKKNSSGPSDRYDAVRASTETLMLLQKYGARLSPLSPEMVLEFHQVVMHNLVTTPGRYRREPISVSDTHVPPKARDVARHVKEMCEYTHRFGLQGSQDLHTAAFALWRLSWIHPFSDGNGRVARLCCSIEALRCTYETECAYRISQLIEGARERYYSVLEQADEAWLRSDQTLDEKVNVDPVEELLIEAIYW